MKIKIILFLLIFLMGFSQAENEKKDIKRYNTGSPEIEEDLPGILNDPEVKPVYEACKKEFPKNDTHLEKCLAENLKGKLDKLSEKYIGGELKDKKNKKPQYESVDMSTIKQKSNPAIQKLESYLMEQLQKALYGELKHNISTENQVADHAVFYDLFETQLGKNVISTLSYYCLNADPEKKFYSKSKKNEREKIRQKNLKRLKKENTKQDGKSTLVAYDDWSQCIQTIQHICHKDKTDKFDYGKGDDAIEKKLSLSEDDIIFSNKQACLVTANIKSLKQNLFAVQDIKERLSKNSKDDSGASMGEESLREDTKRRKIYRGVATTKNGKDIEDVTSLSSNELINTSGYGSALEKEANLLKEECLDKKDADICKQFLNSKEERDKLEQARDEYLIRSGKMQEKINKDLKEKEGVTNYLKDEGRDDTNIEKIIKDKPNLASSIEENYKLEKNAILKQLADQINKRSVDNDEDVLSNSSGNKLDEIHSNLKTQANELKELTHYNNIVSGYLELKDGKGNSEMNSQSILKEMEDSAFDQENSERTPGSVNSTGQYNSGDFEKLKEITDKLVEDGDDSKKDDSKNSNLSPDQISKQILNYTDENEDDNQK